MLNFSVHTEGLTNLKDVIADRCTQAEVILANEVLKDTRPYVPMLTGSLDTRTRLEGNKVVYPGPYARYLYYGKVMETIEGKPPNHFVDKAGNEVIRFPKGSVLRPTERNLKYNKKTGHPLAQSHWFEASKKKNLAKWLRVFKKAVEHGQ